MDPEVAVCPGFDRLLQPQRDDVAARFGNHALRGRIKRRGSGCGSLGRKGDVDAVDRLLEGAGDDADPQQVGQVAEMVGRCFGNTSYESPQGKASILKETNILKLDSTKAKTRLDWKIQKNFEETISSIVDCIKKEKTGVPIVDICHAQVCEYLEGLNKCTKN